MGVRTTYFSKWDGVWGSISSGNRKISSCVYVAVQKHIRTWIIPFKADLTEVWGPAWGEGSWGKDFWNFHTEMWEKSIPEVEEALGRWMEVSLESFPTGASGTF